MSPPRMAVSPERAGPADAELVRRAAEGDRDAFRELHRRWAPYVHSLARRLLGGGGDPEDASQEAWLKVHRQARRLRDVESFRPWVRALVVRTCLDVVRRGRAPFSVASPEGVEPRQAARLDLERALRSLPADLRLTIVLHDVEGLSHGEIAGLLGIREEASRARLCRARRRLRARLEDG